MIFSQLFLVLGFNLQSCIRLQVGSCVELQDLNCRKHVTNNLEECFRVDSSWWDKILDPYQLRRRDCCVNGLLMSILKDVTTFKFWLLLPFLSYVDFVYNYHKSLTVLPCCHFSFFCSYDDRNLTSAA